MFFYFDYEDMAHQTQTVKFINIAAATTATTTASTITTLLLTAAATTTYYVLVLLRAYSTVTNMLGVRSFLEK